jgi:hypothetical protein
MALEKTVMSAKSTRMPDGDAKVRSARAAWAVTALQSTSADCMWCAVGNIPRELVV